MKRSFWAVVAALALAPLAGAQEPASGTPSSPPPRNVEARAEQELKRMNDFLAKLPHFALEAEETFDELPDGTSYPGSVVLGIPASQIEVRITNSNYQKLAQ